MRWIVVGCIAVVLFDTIASVAAEGLDFEYGNLFPISFAIYGVTAFVAARAERSVRIGVAAGAAVALADATAGWAISWAIGPGAPDERERDVATVVATALLVVATGAAIGLVAGGLQRAFR